MPLTAVGAYLYAGAFAVGVERAGFEVLCHLEGDNAYGVSSARLNWPDRPIYHGPARWPLGDLRNIDIDFAFSNPPCACFSQMGISTTRGPDGWKTDPRIQHWRDSFSLLEKVAPRALCIESVTQAYTRGRELIDELTKRSLVLGYSVTHLLLNAKWHGIPQSRKRLFFLAHRPAKLVGYAPSRNWAPPPTVGEVLDGVGDPGPIPWDVSRFQQGKTVAYAHLLKNTPPGGRLSTTWERVTPRDEWESHRNAQGKLSGRPSFRYHRLDPEKPMGAFTDHDLFHWAEDRVLGINEMKALCGYPLDFQLAGPVTQHGSLLARAVMPPVGEWLARAIAATLTQPDATREDRRVTLIDVRGPDLEPIDLTPAYLDDRGKVRLRVTADGSVSYAVQRAISVPPSASKPTAAPVVRAAPERAPAVAKMALIPLGEPSETISRDDGYQMCWRSDEPRIEVIQSVTPSGFDAKDPVYAPRSGEGSGQLIRRLWRETTLTPDQIVAVVHANWKGRKTSVMDVSWNYSQLTKTGEQVRPWPGRSRSGQAPRSLARVGSTDETQEGAVLASAFSAFSAEPRQAESSYPSGAIGIGAPHPLGAPEAPSQEAAPDSGFASGSAAAPARAASALAVRSTIVPERRGSIDRAMVFFSKLPPSDSGKKDPLSSMRIAWFLESEIAFDRVYHAGSYPTDVVPSSIGELWVVNSSWMWMSDEWRRVSMRLFAVADRIIFVQNDPMLILNSFHLGVIRDDARYAVLSTAPGSSLQAKHGTNPLLVDWNVLTYEPRPETDAERRRGVYYYGSFRTGRKKVFDRYFADPPECLVVTASNGSDAKAYREAYPRLNVAGGRVEDVYAELETWAATLLLEDEKAAETPYSPPNRFYEALSARTPMIFDRSSVAIWRRHYELDVEPFAIDGPSELPGMLDRIDFLADLQTAWHRDYRTELRERLGEARVLIDQGSIGRLGAPENLKRYVLTENGGQY